VDHLGWKGVVYTDDRSLHVQMWIGGKVVTGSGSQFDPIGTIFRPVATSIPCQHPHGRYNSFPHGYFSAFKLGHMPISLASSNRAGAV
jgi:hypothetical protein